jgi:mannose-6-phosphate isomerase-like protein (cupin superfamily)
VLVRRLAEAPTEEWHRLRNHILMDAGELGSRNMSVTWLEVPAGIDQELHSHEEAEQVYIVVSGRGTMTVMVPPATDHSIANGNSADLCCVSVQSPPVTASEVFGPTGVGAASEYEED